MRVRRFTNRKKVMHISRHRFSSDIPSMDQVPVINKAEYDALRRMVDTNAIVITTSRGASYRWQGEKETFGWTKFQDMHNRGLIGAKDSKPTHLIPTEEGLTAIAEYEAYNQPGIPLKVWMFTVETGIIAGEVVAHYANRTITGGTKEVIEMRFDGINHHVARSYDSLFLSDDIAFDPKRLISNAVERYTRGIENATAQIIDLQNLIANYEKMIEEVQGAQ